MARAYAYCRQSKSRAEDDADSLSIQMQEHQIRQWAAAHGYEIVRVYEDQDVSGRTDNRPAYRQLLADIRERRDVQAVITYKYSRFARNVRVFANGHGELQDRGVDLLSTTESGDTRMIQVSAMMADWYSTDLSEFVSAALHAKARRGQWHGIVPVGYVKDKETQRLVIDPPAAAFVAEVFDRYIGGETIAAIIGWIADEPALADIRGRMLWSYHAIDRLLRRRAYLGHTSGMEGAHPPIIDQATFDAADRLRRRPVRHQRKAITSPLEGMVRCGACGLAMRLSTVKRTDANRGYSRFWRCESLLRQTAYGETYPAHQQMFRADWIEDAVRDRLMADLAGMVRVEDALAHARRDAGSDGTAKRRAALERQRARAQDGRDRLLGLYRDGRLDADRWEDADRDAAADIARIDAELAGLPTPPDPAVYDRAARLLGDVAGVIGVTTDDAAMQAGLDAGLRRLLLAIGATVTIDARPPRRGRKRMAPSVTIAYGEPFARIICP